MVRYEPDEADLLATERKVEAIWAAIEEARRTGVFEPNPGRQCDWCAFKAHCPAWGGELLPMPPPPSRWSPAQAGRAPPLVAGPARLRRRR